MHHYFFSYARADASEYLRRFYDDLREAVRSKTGVASPDAVGFRDAISIQPGSPWPESIVTALSSCNVFVYVHSPTYFTRDGCGREFEVIRQRLLKKGRGQLEWGPCLLPIYWDGPKQISNTPNEIAKIQLTHEVYPQTYNEKGMLQLTRSGFQSKDYWETINEFAERIYSGANNSPLPELMDLPEWSKIKPFFPINDNEVPTAKLRYGPKRPPTYARFIWIVGTRDELTGLRDLKPYDEDGIAEDWRPFTPETFDPGRLIASDAARAAGLTYAVVNNDSVDNLVKLIQELSSDFVPVIVVIDAWTLSIERYRKVVNFLDKQNFFNCVVVVPWNPLDEDTANKESVLQRNLAAAFPVQYYRQDTYIRFKQGKGLKSFKKEIQNSLVRFVGDINRSLTAARTLPEAVAFTEFPQLIAAGR